MNMNLAPTPGDRHQGTPDTGKCNHHCGVGLSPSMAWCVHLNGKEESTHSAPVAEGREQAAVEILTTDLLEKFKWEAGSVCLALQLSPCCQDLRRVLPWTLNPSGFLYISLESSPPLLLQCSAAHKTPPTHLCRD